jgi:hypothetical protein
MLALHVFNNKISGFFECKNENPREVASMLFEEDGKILLMDWASKYMENQLTNMVPSPL